MAGPHARLLVPFLGLAKEISLIAKAQRKRTFFAMRAVKFNRDITIE